MTRRWWLGVAALVGWAGCGAESEKPTAPHTGAADGERFPLVANQLPSEHGPVPKARGQDRRPAVPRPVRNTRVTRAEGTSTLVLYDDAGPYGWLGELYGIATKNLATHFGAVTAKPVSAYQPAELEAHTLTIYIGSTYDQPLPVAFLDDVLAGTRPVMWMYSNIWQLANRAPSFYARFGFDPWRYDFAPIGAVEYKGRTLTRDLANGSGIMEMSPFDATRVTTLATARREDGTALPWAMRSQHLTYISEIPFAYIAGNDRYLAFCDLLFDALAPQAPERHRALVRIEDVTPNEDPQALRRIADTLFSRNIPFSVAVVPSYRDPRGAYNNGRAESVDIGSVPQFVEALRYMVQRGGTLVLHGNTHQYGDLINPYSGVSADDFEFFIAHVDSADYVIYDGPVPVDSAAWALSRVDSALAAVTQAGLPTPAIFEYPHYAGSPVDSRAISARLPVAYHRGLYFGGALRGGGQAGNDDLARVIGQFFPYTVDDVYGFRVLPENLGNFEPEPYNHHPARLPSDIIDTAARNLVVRDGVASFFFHPYFELTALEQIVDGVRGLGYTFVAPADLLR